MEAKLLIFSIIAATFGFVLWFTLSPSLRLPKSFQVHFDVNYTYANRVIGRRILGFLIFCLLPLLLLLKWEILGPMEFSDLNIHFGWNRRATFWTLSLLPLILFFGWSNTKRDFTLAEYPEIRVTRWTPWLLITNALSWILYLFALEFLYRGLLLQSLLMVLDKWGAIMACAGIYIMIHYYKRNMVSLFSIPYGVLAAYITIDTGSILPVIVLHIANAFITEGFSIARHPEIKVAG